MWDRVESPLEIDIQGIDRILVMAQLQVYSSFENEYAIRETPSPSEVELTSRQYFFPLRQIGTPTSLLRLGATFSPEPLLKSLFVDNIYAHRACEMYNTFIYLLFCKL